VFKESLPAGRLNVGRVGSLWEGNQKICLKNQDRSEGVWQRKIGKVKTESEIKILEERAKSLPGSPHEINLARS